MTSESWSTDATRVHISVQITWLDSEYRHRDSISWCQVLILGYHLDMRAVARTGRQPEWSKCSHVDQVTLQRAWRVKAIWKEKRSQQLSLIKMRTGQITLQSLQDSLFLSVLPFHDFPLYPSKHPLPKHKCEDSHFLPLRECCWWHSLWCLCDFKIATKELVKVNK